MATTMEAGSGASLGDKDTVAGSGVRTSSLKPRRTPSISLLSQPSMNAIDEDKAVHEDAKNLKMLTFDDEDLADNFKKQMSICSEISVRSNVSGTGYEEEEDNGGESSDSEEEEVPKKGPLRKGNKAIEDWLQTSMEADDERISRKGLLKGRSFYLDSEDGDDSEGSEKFFPVSVPPPTPSPQQFSQSAVGGEEIKGKKEFAADLKKAFPDAPVDEGNDSEGYAPDREEAQNDRRRRMTKSRSRRKANDLAA